MRDHHIEDDLIDLGAASEQIKGQIVQRNEDSPLAGGYFEAVGLSDD
ncbi:MULTISPECIES: benenodin family lasso peptide [Brevundimonas]|uniref:Benenodin family lasso peptide n=1 Tax=Brevundimonas abyssalis TAR-001 TaxID=1391729 RepID=A0A8E0NAF3_9CAUL|nr:MULTISPECIES: benenodin family lasso peptide [Brevundimonas]GAD58276.1 hypothetical protein MBEBAB_0526 [Brevundimonas abyssalis TAR-001]